MTEITTEGQRATRQNEREMKKWKVETEKDRQEEKSRQKKQTRI